MKEGINKSITLIGNVLLVVGIGFIYNTTLPWNSRMDHSLLIQFSAGIGIIIGSIPLFLSYFLKINKYWKYITQFLVSYLLAYFLISSGLNFFKDLVFYLDYGMLEQKLATLEDAQMYSAAMSRSSIYQHFLGWSMLASSFLLCFRRTRALGTIGAVAITSNILIIGIGFNYNYTALGKYLFTLSMFLGLTQWKLFSNIFFFNRRPKKNKYPLAKAKKVYEPLALLKVICFVGVIIYFHYEKEDSFRRKMVTKDNPIVGVWKITESSFDKDFNQTKEFLEAEALYFDKSSTAYIKHDDSLSIFKYHINSSDQQFDMYAFQEFRDIDLKGKFEIIDSDTILFKGKNLHDSLSVRLVRDGNFQRYLNK